MDTREPLNIRSTKTALTEKLTSAEMGKLWATYTGNSMSKCYLHYFLQHVEDREIKNLLKKAYKLCSEFLNTTEAIFKKEEFPIPKGFSIEEDINLDAPRLFEDEYYVHYLKYTAKAGMSIYNVALPLVFREDIKDFFIYCLKATMALMEQIKELLMKKGLISKPSIIPLPEKADFAQKGFLNGYIGQKRPLHALEIAHLYDNIENNAASKALIMAFSQVCKKEETRELFIRGEKFTHQHVELYMEKLHNEGLSAPSFLDHLVTTSTVSPFSEKIMLFHKTDMFSMKIRSFGNSLAVNGRHDLAFMYTKGLTQIAKFVEDAAKIMIKNGWMEHPPYAAQRDMLSK